MEPLFEPAMEFVLHLVRSDSVSCPAGRHLWLRAASRAERALPNWANYVTGEYYYVYSSEATLLDTST